MREHRRADRTPAEPDPAGPGPSWRPAPGLVAVAAGIVSIPLVWWWTSPAPVSGAAAAAPAAAAPAPAAASSAAGGAAPAVAAASSRPSPALPVAAAPAPPRIARMRDPGGDQTPDLSDYVNEGERPTMSEVIARLRQAGVQGGLAAFSPPGTRPPLVGLEVPENFPLPDGYVRHHQVTDDGQRIEPILMFAPDRQFVDAAGRPIAIPPDRVVPPELAPPGLPARRITIPAPVDAGTPVR